jgi:hypothetical protein
MIPSRLKADSDYMNAMSSVEVENKNYTVNQLNAMVKRIITNGLYLIKKKVATDNLLLLVYDQKHGDTYQYMDKLPTYYKAKSQYSVLKYGSDAAKRDFAKENTNTLMARDKTLF